WTQDIAYVRAEPRRRRLGAARARAGVVVAELQLAATGGRVERRPAREAPAVDGPVESHVLDPRLDAERVLAAPVVVRRAVALVGREVDEVGALDEAQALERDAHLGLALEAARNVVLEVGVGAVDADAVGREQADPEHEVLDRLARGDREHELERLAGHEHVPLALARVQQAHRADLHLAAAPAPRAIGARAARLGAGLARRGFRARRRGARAQERLLAAGDVGQVLVDHALRLPAPAR